MIFTNIFILLSLSWGKINTRNSRVDLNREIFNGNVSNHGRNVPQEAFMPKFLKYAFGAIQVADSVLKAVLRCDTSYPSFNLEVENYSAQNLISTFTYKACKSSLDTPVSNIAAGTKESFSGVSKALNTGACGLAVWEITSKEKILAVYWDMPANFNFYPSRNTLGFGIFDSDYNVDNLFDDFANGKGDTSAYVTKRYYPEKADPLVFSDGSWYLRGSMTTSHNGFIKVYFFPTEEGDLAPYLKDHERMQN